jgi:predicted dehydrogenase
MEKAKIAIAGFGGRGRMYAGLVEKMDNAELSFVCDKSKENLKYAEENHKGAKRFHTVEEFFALGKVADIVIIATNDAQHYECTIPAIKTGYDILLEKPISTNLKESMEIAECARQYGVKVAVCHVLRYAPFYTKIKELVSSGLIGQIASISQNEDVGYWHQAHTFVRGWGSVSAKGTPMIVQKCCHDMDIIAWLMEKKCNAVSSFGNLLYFNPEHAPEVNAKHCVDCKNSDCVYNCFDYYRNYPASYKGISHNPDIDAVLSNRSNPFSRCVFHCGNDVVDHQVVIMQFEEGKTAHLNMTGFSKDCRRRIKIHGTAGEIEGDMLDEKVVLTRYGKGGICTEKEEFDICTIATDLSGHGGGDFRMLEDFINNVMNQTDSAGLTDIQFSLESHLMAFGAEESRLNNGKVITLH